MTEMDTEAKDFLARLHELGAAYMKLKAAEEKARSGEDLADQELQEVGTNFKKLVEEKKRLEEALREEAACREAHVAQLEAFIERTQTRHGDELHQVRKDLESAQNALSMAGVDMRTFQTERDALRKERDSLKTQRSVLLDTAEQDKQWQPIGLAPDGVIVLLLSQVWKNGRKYVTLGRYTESTGWQQFGVKGFKTIPCGHTPLGWHETFKERA